MYLSAFPHKVNRNKKSVSLIRELCPAIHGGINYIKYSWVKLGTILLSELGKVSGLQFIAIIDAPHIGPLDFKRHTAMKPIR
jgi:hypothetical protein